MNEKKEKISIDDLVEKMNTTQMNTILYMKENDEKDQRILDNIASKIDAEPDMLYEIAEYKKSLLEKLNKDEANNNVDTLDVSENNDDIEKHDESVPVVSNEAQVEIANTNNVVENSNSLPTNNGVVVNNSESSNVENQNNEKSKILNVPNTIRQKAKSIHVTPEKLKAIVKASAKLSLLVLIGFKLVSFLLSIPMVSGIATVSGAGALYKTYSRGKKG